MILRGLASIVVVGLLGLNWVLPSAKISARGRDALVRAETMAWTVIVLLPTFVAGLLFFVPELPGLHFVGRVSGSGQRRLEFHRPHRQCSLFY